MNKLCLLKIELDKSDQAIGPELQNADFFSILAPDAKEKYRVLLGNVPPNFTSAV